MLRKWAYTGVLVAAVAVAAVYFVFDPSESVFFPRCVFRAVTGWDCPGCGSQRAIHALLHGNVAEAFRYNAGLLVGLPLLVLLCVVEVRRASMPRLHRALTSTPFVVALLTAVVVWWIGRNIF